MKKIDKNFEPFVFCLRRQYLPKFDGSPVKYRLATPPKLKPTPKAKTTLEAKPGPMKRYTLRPRRVLDKRSKCRENWLLNYANAKYSLVLCRKKISN